VLLDPGGAEAHGAREVLVQQQEFEDEARLHVSSVDAQIGFQGTGHAQQAGERLVVGDGAAATVAEASVIFIAVAQPTASAPSHATTSPADGLVAKSRR
jgi:hypothetical protein